ncbi:MAG: hypothetical protein US68_C0037G0001, partial [Candidatus Shapirobacteria bacterium GW2011_GWE1_38_10]
TAWDIGRKADATVGITIDYATEPYQIVAFERMERVPYPEQQTAIAKRHVAFPGRTVVEDNGPGDPVVGNLPVKVESRQWIGLRCYPECIKSILGQRPGNMT